MMIKKSHKDTTMSEYCSEILVSRRDCYVRKERINQKLLGKKLKKKTKKIICVLKEIIQKKTEQYCLPVDCCSAWAHY